MAKRPKPININYPQYIGRSRTGSAIEPFHCHWLALQQREKAFLAVSINYSENNASAGYWLKSEALFDSKPPPTQFNELLARMRLIVRSRYFYGNSPDSLERSFPFPWQVQGRARCRGKPVLESGNPPRCIICPRCQSYDLKWVKRDRLVQCHGCGKYSNLRSIKPTQSYP